MIKSKHNTYNRFSEIPVEELTNFINPINMSIQIDRDDLYSLFKTNRELNNTLINNYNQIFDVIPSMPLGNKDKFIKRYLSITYTPHIEGYDFRLNPIDFFNNLFVYMKLDYKIPFINLDNGYGMSYLKDYIKAYIKDFFRDQSQVLKRTYSIKRDVLSEILDNLDNILNMYYININDVVNNYVVPKDMLLYLAYISLNKYEEEKDERYLVMPYEYYHCVSHMNTSTFPHMVSVNGEKKWFTNFREKYQDLVGRRYEVDDKPYILNNHEILLAWDILKPGMLEREIRDTHEFIRSASNVDYEKYLKLFEVKMNYYMNSPYINYIQGKYGLLGYIGFSYDNDYLLFDKFHNSDTINPNNKTILTHGEAIYALPADRFGILKDTKQGIIEAKKSDDRIKKINHTPNYSFINKLDNIIEGPNLSTLTFDEAIMQEKRKMLIKK